MATTGVTLVNAPLILPPVPDSLASLSTDLFVYLQNLRLAIQQQGQRSFANDSVVVGALNSGTSGTFVVASGGHILITSGIVTAVSTT